MSKFQYPSENLFFQIVIFYLIISILFPLYLRSLPANLLGEENSLCNDHLQLAEECYYAGEFDRATELINQCLRERTVSDANRIKAYIILTRISLAEDDVQSARNTIEIILKIDPSYQPTIEEETPKFVNLVAEIKTALGEAKDEKSGMNKWILVGAGGVATTAIILLVAAKGGNNKSQDNKLPEPPQFP